MMKSLRRFLTVLIAVLSLTICAGSFAVFANDDGAQAAARADGQTLYYFVNAGDSQEISQAETSYRLTATLGNGDKAYATGHGYTAAGTVGGESGLDMFDSYRTGAVGYKFDLEDGTYQVAVGLTGSETVSVNVGGAAEDCTVDGDTVYTKASVTVTGGSLEVSVNTGNVAFVSVASVGAKILVRGDTQAYGVIKYGDMLETEVDALYTDGAGKVTLEYVQINTEEANKLYSMTDATARIAGTDVEFAKKLMVMPEGLVYFVNAGSVTGNVDPAVNDVYYGLNDVILSAYSGMLNTVIDQEFTGDATWGYTSYTADYPTSSKQLPTTPTAPMPPAYPFNTIRCTDKSPYGIEYNFTGLEGEYNVYVGTRSHWHGRKVTPYINGVAKDQFNLDANNKIQSYRTTDADGRITVKIQGPGAQDEGSIAFVAIQPVSADLTETVEVPKTPVYDGTLEIGQTEFTLKDIKKDTKIQVSVGETPYTMLFEQIAQADGDMVVTLPLDRLADASAVRIAAISKGGASEYTRVAITDITGVVVTPDTKDWTERGVTLTIQAHSLSGLSRLEVIKGYDTTAYTLDGKANLSYNYIVTDNGTYTFKLYSGKSTYTEVYDVANIDNGETSLTVKAATAYKTGKTSVSFDLMSVAAAANLRIYNNGALVETLDEVPSVYELSAAGEYVFAVTTKSGKQASASLRVTDAPTCFNITETELLTNKKVTGRQVNVVSANGKTVARYFAYTVKDGKLSRLSVTGDGFKLYEDTSIVLLVEYEDGTNEYFATDIKLLVEEEGGCKSSLAGAGMIGFGLLAAAGVVGLIAARKRARKTSRR